MNPARKHSGNDDCHKKPDDGSDKKHLELIQFIILSKPDRFGFNFNLDASKISFWRF